MALAQRARARSAILRAQAYVALCALIAEAAPVLARWGISSLEVLDTALELPRMLAGGASREALVATLGEARALALALAASARATATEALVRASSAAATAAAVAAIVGRALIAGEVAAGDAAATPRGAAQ